MSYETDIARFVASAREYCAWVESPAATNEIFEAVRLLSRLHADAAVLPGIDEAHLPEEDDIPELPHAHKQALAARFREFPFQYYWEIFHPIVAEPEEPVLGDITDDFSDVYIDVKSGLLAYDAGRYPSAVWHWRFAWGIHWGRHAVSALKALQIYEPLTEGAGEPQV